MPAPVRVALCILASIAFAFGAYDACRKGQFKINGWSSVISIEKSKSPTSFSIAVSVLIVFSIACFVTAVFVIFGP
jgi:hypothetical protein